MTNIKNIFIILEGVNDLKFLKDYLQYCYGLGEQAISFIGSRTPTEIRLEKTNLKVILRQIGGWAQIKNKDIQSQLSEDVEKADISLIIFDVDDDSGIHPDGGFENRFNAIQKAIDHWKLNKKIDFDTDIFLLPNNQDDGDIETLLHSIIPLDKKPGMDCVKQFYECLESKKILDPTIKIPDKHKIYQTNYPNIFGLGRTDIHWDFGSSSLSALKDFLDEHFLQGDSEAIDAESLS